MNRIIRGVAGGLLAALVSVAHANCLWVTGDDVIRQVNTDTNAEILHVRLDEPLRMAMDAGSCGIWVLQNDQRRLRRFDEHGAPQLDLQLRDLRLADPRWHLDNVRFLAIDPYDGSVWV